MYIHISYIIYHICIIYIDRRGSSPWRRSGGSGLARRTRSAPRAAGFVARRSGVSRGRREHKGSFGDIVPQKVEVRCSLDSCLLLSSFFARSPPLRYPPYILTSIDSRGGPGPPPRQRSRGPPRAAAPQRGRRPLDGERLRRRPRSLAQHGAAATEVPPEPPCRRGAALARLLSLGACRLACAARADARGPHGCRPRRQLVRDGARRGGVRGLGPAQLPAGLLARPPAGRQGPHAVRAAAPGPGLPGPHRDEGQGAARPRCGRAGASWRGPAIHGVVRVGHLLRAPPPREASEPGGGGAVRQQVA